MSSINDLFEKTLYCNMILYVRRNVHPFQVEKYMNIPDHMFADWWQKAKSFHATRNAEDKKYLLFFNKQNECLVIKIEKDGPFYDIYKEIKTLLFDKDFRYQHKIKKLKKVHLEKPDFYDYELKVKPIDLTDKETISNIEFIVECLKSLRVTRQRAIKRNYQLITADWYVWIDDMDFVHFQLSECYEYGDRTYNDHTYSFNFSTQDPLKKKLERKRKLQFDSVEDQTDDLKTKRKIVYFYGNKSKEISGLPVILYGRLQGIRETLEKYVVASKYDHLQEERRLLQMMFNYCYANIDFPQRFCRMYVNEIQDSYVFVNRFSIEIQYSDNGQDHRYIFFFNPQTIHEKISIIGAFDSTLDSSMTTSQFENTMFRSDGKLYIVLEKLKLCFLFLRGYFIHGSELSIHPLAIEHFPEYILKKYIDKKVSSVLFLNDNLDYQDGVDNGGLSRQFLNNLNKALFRPFAFQIENNFKKMIDMDPEHRFPFFRSGDAFKKLYLCEIIVNFWSVIIQRKQFPLGHVLPAQFFEALREVTVFEHLCHIHSIECNAFDQFNVELHEIYHTLIMNLLLKYLKPSSEQALLANFIKINIPYTLAKVGYTRQMLPEETNQYAIQQTDDFNKQLQGIQSIFNILGFDFVDLSPWTIFDIGMNEILRPKVEPFLQFLFYMNRAMRKSELSHDFFVENKEFLFGKKFGRLEVAQCVRALTKTPQLIERAFFLAEHIRDRSTPKKWIQSLLFTVTGTTEFTSTTTITVSFSVDCRIPVAHTCMQTIDVFEGPHENYRISKEAASLYEAEFKKKADNPKDMFLADINYMIKSSSANFSLA